MSHIPVLLKEVIEYLKPEPGKNFIDCTIGSGGHTFAILEKTKPNGKILGIDYFPEAIDEFNKIIQSNINLKNRVILINENFVNLKEIIQREKFKLVHGILFDLGLSIDLLKKSNRGFSFQKEEILDMRFNPFQENIRALDILNKWPEEKIAQIFKEFGEERFSKLIVLQIVKRRKREEIKTTTQLVDLIKLALGKKFHIKSLARIFQALRIVVNNELENLKKVLPDALEILEKEGRLAVISYHSLEDRIVKNFFREKSKSSFLKILIPKIVRPTFKEIKENPRSRSARLRVAEKV